MSVSSAVAVERGEVVVCGFQWATSVKLRIIRFRFSLVGPRRSDHLRIGLLGVWQVGTAASAVHTAHVIWRTYVPLFGVADALLHLETSYALAPEGTG